MSATGLVPQADIDNLLKRIIRIEERLRKIENSLAGGTWVSPNTWHDHEPDWTHPLLREDRPE
jgi:hypothetical protein